VRRAPPEMLPDEATPLLRTAEAARLLAISPDTLKDWRQRRRRAGPAFIRVGRRVRYQIEDLAAYLRRHRVCAHSRQS
jgi:excisionase family DNA binding protein